MICLVFTVQRQRLLFACVVWFTFMYFFWKLGDPFPILSPKHGKMRCFFPSESLTMKGSCSHYSEHIFSLRYSVYRAAHQPCRGHWGHTDGAAVRIWCCELPLHIHVLFPEVTVQITIIINITITPWNI